MTALRVLLVVCVLVVVAASTDASASSTATGTWTLTVTFAGTGTGLVTTSPAGIVCTNENPDTVPGAIPQSLGTCSAQFPVGVAPWVIATPSGGSRGSVLGGISNCTGEKGPCQTGGNPGATTVDQVTFNPKPIPCTVDRLIGDTLAMAKHHLHEIGCKVGTVRYAYGYGPRTPAGVVISQNPKPHWQLPPGAVGAVNLVISKLKPKPRS